MAKDTKARKTRREHRADPARSSPQRSAANHLRHNSASSKGSGEGTIVSDTVQKAITDAVSLGYSVIERQIHEGQQAADRLREGISTSQALNTDVTKVVESLVATTKDVGAAWLGLMSIVVRSVAPQSTTPNDCTGMQQNFAGLHSPGLSRATITTTTRTASSGGATTISSITSTDPSGGAKVPVAIVVKGRGAEQVTLDLRPPSASFAPFARPLAGNDPRHSLAVSFGLSDNKPVLTVDIPTGLPAGTYSGAVIDSSTNAPGGTVSVTVGKVRPKTRPR